MSPSGPEEPDATVTLRDVAQRAGVHPATVSRTLNDETRARVSAKTAERVMRAADELGYKPNPLARGLKTNRSFTVGVLIPDLTNPLFPPIVRGIEAALDPGGYTSLIANTDNDRDRERVAVAALRARQVDGLIAATARRGNDLLGALADAGIAVVLVNRSADGAALPAVTVDDGLGIRFAVQHLLALGHRRIAHIAGSQELSTGRRRHRGFLEVMAEVGPLHPDAQVRFARTFSEMDGARLCRELLDVDPPPTAVVAGNDLLALGCYDALAERGLSCPGDLSVVGFNDMPFADRFMPPLTTVRIPHYRLGTEAGELMLERLADSDAPVRHRMLTPELVVRGSTATLA